MTGRSLGSATTERCTGRTLAQSFDAKLPTTTDELANILAEEPETTLVAGATDVGLWINKDLRDIAPMDRIDEKTPSLHLSFINNII